MPTLEQEIIDYIDTTVSPEYPKVCYHSVESIAEALKKSHWEVYKALLNMRICRDEILKIDMGGMEFYTTRKRLYEVSSKWDRFWFAFTDLFK